MVLSFTCGRLKNHQGKCHIHIPDAQEELLLRGLERCGMTINNTICTGCYDSNYQPHPQGYYS